MEKKRSDGEMEIISMLQWVIDRFIPNIQAGFYIRRKPNKAWKPQCLLPAVVARLYTRIQDRFIVAGSNYSRVIMQQVAKHIQEWSDQHQVYSHQLWTSNSLYGCFFFFLKTGVIKQLVWLHSALKAKRACFKHVWYGFPYFGLTPKYLAAKESLSKVSL